MNPDPYPLPFKDPFSIRHSYAQPIPKGHVCAIEYHRDDSGRLHPHSVWTAEEATREEQVHAGEFIDVIDCPNCKDDITVPHKNHRTEHKQP